jgi:hypothetical protein
MIYHFLILFQMIGYENTWGGRLKSVEEMQQMEAISLVINVLILWITAMRGKHLAVLIPQRFIQLMMWVFFGLFLLNTLGNLTSLSSLETILFTPITLILSMCFLRLAWVKG